MTMNGSMALRLASGRGTCLGFGVVTANSFMNNELAVL
jgi:hypothetical protein